MKITQHDLHTHERFYRANLLNCLSGFKSVSLIGTRNTNGLSNLAIFSNIVHLGADPALVGFINRPLAASKHTLHNIEQTGYYTINHIQPDMVERAHQTSAKYPDNISEFEAVHITEEQTEFHAPYVKDSLVKYGLKHVQTIPIALNNTYLVIGEVLEIHIPDFILQPDGFLKLDLTQTITSLGLDAYYTTEPLNRFPYAKV